MTGKPIDEAALDRACEAYAEIADDCMGLVRRRAMREALIAAQQGQAVDLAPPSAPVGVEGLLADLETIWHSVSDDKETNAAYQRLKSALAQKSAAVDEAIAQRAAKALLDCRSYIGSERPDDPDDEDRAQWWDELTELAAALATQPQEPTT